MYIYILYIYRIDSKRLCVLTIAAHMGSQVPYCEASKWFQGEFSVTRNWICHIAAKASLLSQEETLLVSWPLPGQITRCHHLKEEINLFMVSEVSVHGRLSPWQQYSGKARRSKDVYFMEWRQRKGTAADRKGQGARYGHQDHAPVMCPDTPRSVLYLSSAAPSTVRLTIKLRGHRNHPGIRSLRLSQDCEGWTMDWILWRTGAQQTPDRNLVQLWTVPTQLSRLCVLGP